MSEVKAELNGIGSVPDLYAPPMVFGPWVVIASHIGSITYRINFEPVGDTLIFGQIRYFKYRSFGKVEEEIVSGSQFVTADVIANIEARFKGNPTGSAVSISLKP